MTTYLLLAGAAAVLALLLTPPRIRYANRGRLLDAPGRRKVHAQSTPRIGGLAVLVASAVPLVAGGVLVPALRDAAGRLGGTAIYVLVALALVTATGLWDDARGLSAKAKLVPQLVAAVLVVVGGVRLDRLAVSTDLEISLGWLAAPLTVAWLVGVTNAMNLIDGLDGLAGGIALIASVALAAFAAVSGAPLIAGGLAAVAGAVAGFLKYNAYPARTFLGDGGAFFLGFALAVASVLLVSGSQRPLAALVPLGALFLPLLDVALAIVRRAIRRRSLFAPDKGHIHHRLLAAGLSHRRAVAVLLLLAAGVAAVALGVGADRESATVLLVVGTIAAAAALCFLPVRAIVRQARRP